MTKPIIAVDGPAASGKGTLARKLAEKLDFAYMDTGVLYRAVAFEVIDTGLSFKDKRDTIDAAQNLLKKLQNAPDPNKILSNPRLRDDDIGQGASKVAAIPEIRQILKDMQRDFAENPGDGVKGAVLDGRDIGTVICPDADLKLFVTAKVEVRAKRRLKELQSKGITATYGDVLDDMLERDSRDVQRKDAPMTRADDAIVINNSDRNAEETFEMALKIVNERLNLQ